MEGTLKQKIYQEIAEGKICAARIMIFDCMYINGMSLLNEPYWKRSEVVKLSTTNQLDKLDKLLNCKNMNEWRRI